MRDVPAHAQIPCPLSKGTVYPIAWPERPCGARVPLVGHPKTLEKSLRGRSNQPMQSESSCADGEVPPTGGIPSTSTESVLWAWDRFLHVEQLEYGGVPIEVHLIPILAHALLSLRPATIPVIGTRGALAPQLFNAHAFPSPEAGTPHLRVERGCRGLW